MTITKLIDLFDPEDPKCVYCDGKEFQFTSTSKSSPTGLSTYYTDTHTCIWCLEEFVVRRIEMHFSTPRVAQHFSISCDDLVLAQMYHDRGLVLYGKSSENDLVCLPFFIPDFSDKQKLYRKLKTILTFS